MRLGRLLQLTFIVALVACGKTEPTSESLLEAQADLRSRSAYHVSVEVRPPQELASEFRGNYEVDFEQPDKYQTVRILDSKEVSRTIAIGDAVFGSADGGRSWEQVPLTGTREFSPAARLLELLEGVCTSEQDGSRLRVEVRSRTQGCDRPLTMRVELSGSVISSIKAKLPTDLGSMDIAASFKFNGPPASIVRPTTQVS